MRFFFLFLLYFTPLHSKADTNWSKLDRNEREKAIEDLQLEIAGKNFICYGQTVGYKNGELNFKTNKNLRSTSLYYYIGRAHKVDQSQSSDVANQSAQRFSSPLMLINGQEHSLMVYVYRHNRKLSKMRIYIDELREISELVNKGTKSKPKYEYEESIYIYKSSYICNI